MEWKYKHRLHLVTGATGLYGRELVRRLVHKGALVRAVHGEHESLGLFRRQNKGRRENRPVGGAARTLRRPYYLR